jgi:hypothetical protein
MARDVTLSLGTALDRLAYSAQRVVGVVTELKQFGTFAASSHMPTLSGRRFSQPKQCG